jgi:hypothetical protein
VGYNYREEPKTDRNYNIVLKFYKKDLTNILGTRSSPSPPALTQRLETTATDPTTRDEPLGVDSAVDAALIQKILPSGGRRDLRAEAHEARSGPLGQG